MHGDFNHGARMEQLYTSQFPGDDKLEDFAKAWQKLTEDKDVTMKEEHMFKLLWGKLIGKSQIMKGDLDDLTRQEEGSEKRTHKYLLGRMWFWVNKRKAGKYELDYNQQIGKSLGAPLLPNGVLSALQDVRRTGHIYDGAPWIP